MTRRAAGLAHLKFGKHGKQLLERVLLPLLEVRPDLIREVCIGCLIRFNVALEYYSCVETGMARMAGMTGRIARH